MADNIESKSGLQLGGMKRTVEPVRASIAALLEKGRNRLQEWRDSSIQLEDLPTEMQAIYHQMFPEDLFGRDPLIGIYPKFPWLEKYNIQLDTQSFFEQSKANYPDNKISQLTDFSFNFLRGAFSQLGTNSPIINSLTNITQPDKLFEAIGTMPLQELAPKMRDEIQDILNALSHAYGWAISRIVMPQDPVGWAGHALNGDLLNPKFLGGHPSAVAREVDLAMHDVLDNDQLDLTNKQFDLHSIEGLKNLLVSSTWADIIGRDAPALTKAQLNSDRTRSAASGLMMALDTLPIPGNYIYVRGTVNRFVVARWRMALSVAKLAQTNPTQVSNADDIVREIGSKFYDATHDGTLKIGNWKTPRLMREGRIVRIKNMIDMGTGTPDQMQYGQDLLSTFNLYNSVLPRRR